MWSFSLSGSEFLQVSFFIHFGEEKRKRLRRLMISMPFDLRRLLSSEHNGRKCNICKTGKRATSHLTCRHHFVDAKVTMDLYCYQKLKQGWGSCFVFVFKGNPNRIIFHNVAVKRFILQITPNKFSIHKTCPLLWPMWPLAYWITSGPLL